MYTFDNIILKHKTQADDLSACFMVYGLYFITIIYDFLQN